MSDLIRRIYDCALQTSQWPAVLQDIATEGGAFGAMLFDCEWREKTECVSLRYCSTAYDPAIVSGYVDEYNAYEVEDQARFALLSSQGDDIDMIRCDDLYANRTTLETRANTQAMMGLGVYYRSGALLSKDTVAIDRFALQFRKHQGPMTEIARIKVRDLLPHVAKALSIGRAFQAVENQRMSLVRTLETLPFGLGIVKANGDFVFSNTEFLKLCEAFALRRTASPQLKVSALPATMQALLRSATAHGKFGARPLREAAFLTGAREGAGVFIEISPISDHPEFERFGDSTFLVSLLDSQRAHTINPEIVRRFFPMTDSELSVLDMVVKGHTNGEIADMRGRSLETVNTQLKSLIRKSGTRNRTELVRIAVSLSVASLNTTLVSQATIAP